VLTLPWRHPCGPVEHAVRDHLREFPQVTRGVRGVGVTSYKVHSLPKLQRFGSSRHLFLVRSPSDPEGLTPTPQSADIRWLCINWERSPFEYLGQVTSDLL
jgi:hypothetical protein